MRIDESMSLASLIHQTDYSIKHYAVSKGVQTATFEIFYQKCLLLKNRRISRARNETHLVEVIIKWNKFERKLCLLSKASPFFPSKL